MVSSKYIYLFISLSIMTILSACSNGGKALINLRKDIDNAEKKIVITNIKDSAALKFSEVFSQIEYIPLENTAMSAIGIVDKIMFGPKGDLITVDKHNNIVLRFNKNGKYLNKIGEVGRKNNEYISINDVIYDKYNHHVIIWDNPKHSLITYTLEGKHVSTVDVNRYVGSMAMMNDNLLTLHTVDNGYEYVVINKEGDELQKYEDRYSAVTNIPLVEAQMETSSWQTVLGHSEYSPLIYEVSDKNIIPKYLFDFKENNIPIEWFALDEGDFNDMLHRSHKVAYCYRFYEASDYYVMTLFKERLYLCVINKNAEEIPYIGNNVYNDMTVIPFFDKTNRFGGGVVPIGVQGNDCYFVRESSDFDTSDMDIAKLNKQLKEDGHEEMCIDTLSCEYKKIKSLAENINPIIMKCTLK